MKMMGMTISLAGKPRRKAMRITPSSPMSLANGSRKEAHQESRLVSRMCRLAMHQMRNPAGTATAAARPSTNRVRSKTERTRTDPI